eukprot:c28189_g1_i1 orf=92-1114(+)
MDFDLLLRHHSHFILGLYNQILSRGYADQNTVFSPVSISLCLAMVAAGAEGSTLQQFASCLRLPNDVSMHKFCAHIRSVVLPDVSHKNGPFVSFASGVWVEQTLALKTTFQQIVERHYGAVSRAADFLNEAENVRVKINAWVEEETKGKIENLLPPSSLSGSTRLVLANALYFKGAWAEMFDASRTMEQEFYLLNGDSVKVPMMTSKEEQEIGIHDSFKILRLSYSQGEDTRSFSMYVILPNERNGLVQLQRMVDVNTMEKHLVHRHKVSIGKFMLPKFKISWELDVQDALREFGLLLPFSAEANFSGIAESSETSRLSISNVFHKAFVEVNEEGTEAAA